MAKRSATSAEFPRASPFGKSVADLSFATYRRANKNFEPSRCLNSRIGLSLPEAAFRTNSKSATWASCPVSSSVTPRKPEEGELALQERWYPIQVKQTEKVGRPDIDAFEACLMRENCDKGFFVGFDYSHDAMTEVGQFFKRSGKVIVPLTVCEIATNRSQPNSRNDNPIRPSSY